MLDIPWWYFLVAIAVGIIVWQIWKRPALGLLAAYSFLLIAETVLIRKPFTGSHFQPELFWSWRMWDRQSAQILTNIVMFIPTGVLAGWLWRWRGILAAIGMSVTIETLQLLTSRGLFEFDDIIHNTFGAALGVWIVIVGIKIINRNRGKKNGHS